MGNCGNFLELANANCGADIGFGKMILVYGSKQDVSLTEMTATAINSAIESGDIIGVIQGWHTIAGAPVAEISVERTGTAEMKLIRPEILADTLTFESNIQNRAVIASLVAAGTLQCLLIDDLGSVFGKKSTQADVISTMPLNFNSKVSNAFQSDNATEKTVAVTVRYLVADEDVAMLFAEVETEDIVVKTQVDGFLTGPIDMTTTTCDFMIALIDKKTQKPYDGDLLVADISVSRLGKNTTVSTVSYTNGVLGIGLTALDFVILGEDFYMSISSAECYMKEIRLRLANNA